MQQFPCGICGDPTMSRVLSKYEVPDPLPVPRPHEIGGMFVRNKEIVGHYTQGGILPVTVVLTQNHQGGYFEFTICPRSQWEEDATEDCLDR